MRSLRRQPKMWNVLVCSLLLLLMPQHAASESCLPSWFRQERSAPEPLRAELETNEIGEDVQKTSTDDVTTSTMNPADDKTFEEVAKELTEKEAEYEYEYEENNEEKSEEAIKYNEEATTETTATMKPSVRKEIERLKEAKCRDYCHHNATCHVEVIFRDDRVSAVVPSCHCPHGWEGTRCDRHYVQAFYAPVSGKYNQNSTSALPAFAFLVVMLLMFVTIVVYAYRRMARRSDETTYTMSHMCPPEAFTVLKTPNGHKLATVTPVTSEQRAPVRQAAIRSTETARNNFFNILRTQGTIPSRSLNEDDTPKHYKSVPRVEVSAINYSGHIDFSTCSYQSDEHEVSKAHATSPPPVAGATTSSTHVVIEMEEHTHFRSPSRSAGEPGTPTTCEPMIPPKR